MRCCPLFTGWNRSTEAALAPFTQLTKGRGIYRARLKEALWLRARQPSFQLGLASAHPAACPGLVLSQLRPFQYEGPGLARLKAFPFLVPPDTAKPGKLRTIPIPVARCYTYSWNQDSFGKQPAGAGVPPKGRGSSPGQLPAPPSTSAPPPPPPTHCAGSERSRGRGSESGVALGPLLPKVLLLEPISPPKGARKAFPVSGHPEDASPCFAADILQEILLKEQELLQPEILDDEEDEDEEDEEEDLDADGHCAERDSVLSTGSAASHASTLSLASSQASGPTLSRQLLTSFVSGLSDGVDSGYMEDIEESAYERPRRPGGHERRGHRRPGQKFNRIYKLFKSTSQMVLRRDSRSLEGSPDSGPPLRRAGSLCSPLDSPTLPPSRAQRSRSLPQPKLGPQLPGWLLAPASRHQRRRPFLSGDEDPKASTLRVVVFGSDRISGKVARAYSNLR